MKYTHFMGSLKRTELDSSLFDLEVDDGTDGGITFAVRSTRFSSAHALLEKRFGRRAVSELTPSPPPIHGSPKSVTSTIYKATTDDIVVASPVSVPDVSLGHLESPATTGNEDLQLSENVEVGSSSTEDVENLIAGMAPIVESGISMGRWEGASAETGSEEMVEVSLGSDSSSLPEEVTFPSFVQANAEANADTGLSFVPAQKSRSVPVTQISSITDSKTKSKWGPRPSYFKRKQVAPKIEKEPGEDEVVDENRLRKTIHGVIELLSTKPSVPKWLQVTARVQKSTGDKTTGDIPAAVTVAAQVN